jgi:acylphosphatase
MTGESVARDLVIHGRVQGVFFRDTLRRVAIDAGVSGWATNSSEGTVEAHLEGPAEAVDRVVEFARRGPERAVVERVDVSEGAVDGLHAFQIG